MSNNKKSVNLGLPALLTGILSIDKRYHGGFYNRGIFGDNILEAVPKYIKSPSEQVINKGNSSIVLAMVGRDTLKHLLLIWWLDEADPPLILN